MKSSLYAAGVTAGVLGALAMDVFAHTAAALRGGREAPGATPGRHRSWRGPQPPQAVGEAGQDAATLAGTAAYRAIAARAPAPPFQRRLGTAMHYGFGASAGLVYAGLAATGASVRRGSGLLYGALVWAIADQGLVPALGLSRGPRELPAGVQAYSLVSHLIYGTVLEAGLRAATSGKYGATN